MELQLTGKNIDLTPEIRDYVQRKLGKMNRYLPNIIGYDVEIFREKTKSPQQRFVVQATIDSGGTLLRGEERGDDLFTAIDRVATVMSRQIERYKGKLYSRNRGSSIRTELAPVEEEEEDEEEEELPGSSEQKVVKVKRFAVKPMSVSEATDQMELLGHNFFLFVNADTEEINLVYRRKDGDYGLISPTR